MWQLSFPLVKKELETIMPKAEMHRCSMVEKQDFCSLYTGMLFATAELICPLHMRYAKEQDLSSDPDAQRATLLSPDTSEECLPTAH